MSVTLAKTRTRKTATARRAELVDAAISLIAEKGFLGLTIQGLADRCAMTNAGVMHHFRSKEDILTAVLRERERRDEDEILSARSDGPEAPLDRRANGAFVREMLRAVVERNAGQPGIIQLATTLRGEAKASDHPAHAYFRDRNLATLEIFRQLVLHVSDEPLSTARQIVSLMQGLEEQWVAEAMTFDLVREWDRAAAVILPEIIDTDGDQG